MAMISMDIDRRRDPNQKKVRANSVLNKLNKIEMMPAKNMNANMTYSGMIVNLFLNSFPSPTIRMS